MNNAQTTGLQLLEQSPAIADAWAEGLNQAAHADPGSFNTCAGLSEEQLQVARRYFLRPGTKTIGYVDDQNHVLAACSIAGSEHISTELVYKHPNAAKGLGRLALYGALQYAYCQTPCESIGIVVREENARMLQLCEAIGFSAIDHIKGRPWFLHLRSREQMKTALDKLHKRIPRHLHCEADKTRFPVNTFAPSTGR